MLRANIAMFAGNTDEIWKNLNIIYKNNPVWIKMMDEVIKKSSENRLSETQLDYWIEKKGYNEEEAKIKLSERQSTFSLEKCISKYGEEEGKDGERLVAGNPIAGRGQRNRGREVGRGASSRRETATSDAAPQGGAAQEGEATAIRSGTGREEGADEADRTGRTEYESRRENDDEECVGTSTGRTCFRRHGEGADSAVIGSRLRTSHRDHRAFPVSRAQVVRRERLGHGTARDAPHVQQRHPIEVLGHGLQIVMHDQYGATARPEFPQNLDDGPFRDGIDALERFIHQVDGCVLNQRAGEKRSLLLAARELADLSRSVV